MTVPGWIIDKFRETTEFYRLFAPLGEVFWKSTWGLSLSFTRILAGSPSSSDTFLEYYL